MKITNADGSLKERVPSEYDIEFPIGVSPDSSRAATAILACAVVFAIVVCAAVLHG